MTETQQGGGSMSTEHPDEGTIHAWLDGALGDADAARLSAHVAACPACAAAVAEARGLIAGASRVVRALDPADMPSIAAPLPPGAPVPITRADPSLWRLLRVTPARAAIAATVLVAVGITLTYDWAARESTVTALQMTSAPEAAAPAPAPMVTPAPRDPLLDSAIRRRIAQSVPPRALERAPGGERIAPTIAPPAAVDATAPARVAVGRAADQAQREAPGIRADRAEAPAVAMRKSVSPDSAMIAANQAPAMAERAAGLGGQCLRVESSRAGATWGPIPLPFVLQLAETNGAGTARLVGTASEQNATLSATWRREGADSLRLDLRRIGYAGALELALADESYAGIMRSAPTASQLEAVTTTSADAGAASDAAPRARRAPARQVPAAPAPATPVLAGKAPSTVVTGAAIPVVARRVACP